MNNTALSNKKSTSDLKKYKPLLLFIVKAVCIYYGLKYLYLGYVGLADPRGAYNLTDFLGNFNLVLLITQAHVLVSEAFLNLIGYSTISYGKVLLITGASGVQIEYACLGVELWIAIIALMMSYPIPAKNPLKNQVLASLAGVFVIFMLNNVRVVTIILTNHYNNSMTQTIHDAFNNVVYVFIFAFFFLWINYWGKKGNRKSYSSSSSTIPEEAKKAEL